MREVFRTSNAVEAALLKSFLGGAEVKFFMVENIPDVTAMVAPTYSLMVLEEDVTNVLVLLRAGGFFSGPGHPEMPEVIETTLLSGRVQLLQPKNGFHASIDTVFLAAGVPLKDKAQMLDVGCGVGSAGLCVLARTHGMRLTGIDIQPDLIEIAKQNAVLNEVEGLCRFVAGDIKKEKEIADDLFSVVLMNPPYQEAGTHTPSPLKNKALSHGEDASGATLEDWVKYGHRKLKAGGTLVMIHRADRMSEVVATLERKRWFGSLVVFPLHSRTGDDAKRVIIRARKERYAPMVLKSGLVIHEADGKYTEAAKDVLERAKGLEL